MVSTVVYSCVSGQYDNPLYTLFKSQPKTEAGVKYVLFVDDVNVVTKRGIWELRPLAWSHASSKRRSAKKCPSASTCRFSNSSPAVPARVSEPRLRSAPL